MTDVVGNPEEERRAEFYYQPWAQEAVCRYFYSKVIQLLCSSGATREVLPNKFGFIYRRDDVIFCLVLLRIVLKNSFVVTDKQKRKVANRTGARD